MFVFEIDFVLYINSEILRACIKKKVVNYFSRRRIHFHYRHLIKESNPSGCIMHTHSRAYHCIVLMLGAVRGHCLSFLSLHQQTPCLMSFIVLESCEFVFSCNEI